MRWPLAAWTLFFLLPVLGFVLLLAYEVYSGNEYLGRVFMLTTPMHFSLPYHMLFLVLCVMLAPDMALFIGMWRLLWPWLANIVHAPQIHPNTTQIYMFLLYSFMLAVLFLFRCAIWHWGATRLARGWPAPYPVALFLVSGAILVLTEGDKTRWYSFNILWMYWGGYGRMLFFATFFLGVFFLVRNIRRPRAWAGKNDP